LSLDRLRRSIEHTFVDNPNHKGNVAELAIATEAAKLGLSVLKPLTEHERYDLVLGIGGRLFRIQCKWGGSARGGDQCPPEVVVSLPDAGVRDGYLRRVGG